MAPGNASDSFGTRDRLTVDDARTRFTGWIESMARRGCRHHVQTQPAVGARCAFPAERDFVLIVFLRRAITISRFITPGGAADFGWNAYTPLSSSVHSPSVVGDLWIMGLARRWLGHHFGHGQHDHHGGVHARARDDDVPAADFHLEHPDHLHHGFDGLPAADRGAVRVGR